MDPIQFAIKNPVKVTVTVLLVLLFGMLALGAIPVQLTPSIDQPIITIETQWTGRSPDEVEREIIEEQEDKLKNVGGLKKMQATAFEGQASVSLEFYVGTDMDEAVREVSDKLREVPEYPDDVDEPVINVSASSSETPIAWTVLSSDDPNFEIESIRDQVEDLVKPYLERVDGISEVRVYGGRRREVHVRVHPQRLAERGITFTELRDALRRANVNVSAGDVPDGLREVRIRAVGEYDSLDKVKATIVKDTDGGPVRVGDVADIELTVEELQGFVRSKGRRALALPCYREVGSNVMRVMDELRKRVAEVETEILPDLAAQIQRERGLDAPPNFKYEQVYDETVYIEDAVALVQSNIVIGGMLAVAMLLAFIRDVRFWPLLVAGLALLIVALIVSLAGNAYWAWIFGGVGFVLTLLASPSTLIIAIAIPVSVIGTFVAMTAAGRSINVISLAGLAFSVGMVVDAAIVVLENIDRHLAMGKPRGKAAFDGAKEVWGAILASALTTLAVFVPVLFIEEEAGQLFRDIALAICAAVSLSLVVSITVIPTAASHWLKPQRKPRNVVTRMARSLFGLTTLLAWMTNTYAHIIHGVTKRSFGAIALRALIVGGATGAAIWGAAALMPPTDYLPAGNRNLVFGFLLTPPAYGKDHDNTIGLRVESVVRPYWEAENYDDVRKLPPVINPMTREPIQNIPPVDNYFFVSITRGMFTGAVSRDKQNVAPLADLLTSTIMTNPDTFGMAFQSSLFGRGLGGNNRIDVEITGHNMQDIADSAGALMGALMATGDYPQGSIRPNPSNFNLASPEMRVEIDRVRAADLSIDQTDLNVAVQTLVDGVTVGDYRLSGRSIDIRIVRDPAYDLTVDTLEMMPLAAWDDEGQRLTVPLESVATIVPADAPQTIQRIEEQRAVVLEITPPAGLALEQAQAKIDEVVAGLRKGGAIKPGVGVEQAGSADKLSQVRYAMLGKWDGLNRASLESLGTSRLFLALLVTYLLMAALFESFLYPMVIMFSVPLAAVGGFMGLAIVHRFNPSQQLDVLTMLGFVILIGVVVNNAILIVHQSLNFMRGEGDPGSGDGNASDAHGLQSVGVVLNHRDAIRESVRTRVRPVMMTTMTSVFGMLPLVLMPGAGSELYRGLGSVVIGGLIVSTFFTLLVVPLLFSLVLDLRAGVTRLLGVGGDETSPETNPPGATAPTT